MQTEILQVHADHLEATAISKAAAVLRSGGLVAFPTETVYGLGANALDSSACALMFAAKGRPANNPVIVHVASQVEAKQVVADWPQAADHLAARFWPGPLTLVLPKNMAVPDVVTAGGPTVAVRVPAHPVALALLQSAGIPVAAPSANLSGQLSPTRAEHVLQSLDGRIDMILDAGPTPGGLESTVLDLSRTPQRLLRPGLVTPREIEAVIGPIERTIPTAVNAGKSLPSPGMLARHYAPRAPMECVVGPGEERVAELARQGLHVGWLRFGGVESTGSGAIVVVMPAEPATYAAQLYAVLHALDDAHIERIVVELPPDTEDWLAVRDRLQRAATV
jgi:L-threonylcarbamoyladenylate synthase